MPINDSDLEAIRNSTEPLAVLAQRHGVDPVVIDAIKSLPPGMTVAEIKSCSFAPTSPGETVRAFHPVTVATDEPPA